MRKPAPAKPAAYPAIPGHGRPMGGGSAGPVRTSGGAPVPKLPGRPLPGGSGGPVPAPRPKVRARKPKPKVKPRTAGLMPCVAVAVARVLGLRADQVLPYCQPGGDLICDVLAALAADGLAGDFWPAEPETGLPGMVIGLSMPEGTHAAVTAGDGLMYSWGLAMPVRGSVDEAWWALPAVEREIMDAQKSDPLAFGRVHDKVMADRAAGVLPAGQKPLAVQLGLVPEQDAAGVADLIQGGDDA